MNSTSKPMRTQSGASKGMRRMKFALLTMLICLISIVPVFALKADSDEQKQKEEERQNTIVQEMADNIVTNHREYDQRITRIILKDWFKYKFDAVEDSYENYYKTMEEKNKTKSELEKVRLEIKAKAENDAAEVKAREDALAAEQARANEIRNNSRYSVDRYSDLSNQHAVISVDDMNNIISHWEKYNGGSPFNGHGDIFIQASQASGLDPIYIFAHASWESNWGKSYLARDRGNYFGINAVDVNPNAAHHMGSTMADGIVNGAVWISQHYYSEGATNLNGMIYGHKQYASAADKWINGINSIMSESYSVLRQSRGM